MGEDGRVHPALIERDSSASADGSGMTNGARAGNGTVTISYTVDPGCAGGPAPSGVVAARPAFTG